MLTAALLMTDKTRKQSKGPSADGQTAELWCVQVMATRRNEALAGDTMWMNLEHVTPSERSQAQKTTWSSFVCTECPDEAPLWRQKVNWQLLRAGVEGEARGGVAKG